MENGGTEVVFLHIGCVFSCLICYADYVEHRQPFSFFFWNFRALTILLSYVDCESEEYLIC